MHRKNELFSFLTFRKTYMDREIHLAVQSRLLEYNLLHKEGDSVTRINNPLENFVTLQLRVIFLIFVTAVFEEQLVAQKETFLSSGFGVFSLESIRTVY